MPDTFGEDIAAELSGYEVVTVQPGQRYVNTLPFDGYVTCLLCGTIVYEQLTDRHDEMHGQA